MAKRQIYLLLPLLAFLSIISSQFVLQAQDTPTENPEIDICADVRYMMDRDVIPYDTETIGGGAWDLTQPVDSRLPRQRFADIWSFGFTPNEPGEEESLTVTFRETNSADPLGNNTDLAVETALEIEVALFFGMDALENSNAITGYQVVTYDVPITFTLRQEGAYSLVVRRTSLADNTNQGAYTLLPVFSGQATPLDDTGYQVTPPADSDSTLYSHPGALTFSGTLGTSGTGLFAQYGQQNSGELRLNDSVDSAYLLGGDLALVGSNANDEPRLFYLQDFDYGTSLGNANGDFTGINYEDQPDLLISWATLRGAWITRDCAGFKYQDGTTFYSPIVREGGEIIFRTTSGTPDEFQITVPAPNRDGTTARHIITFNWQGIDSGSEMSLQDGVFSVDLIGNRRLQLESTRIDLRRQPDESSTASPENVPLAVQLLDEDATLLIDWQQLDALSLIDDQLSFAFQDQRGDVVRNGANLQQLEAIDANIHIIYKPLNTFSNGAQRLWLNAEHGYVELITPAGSFNADRYDNNAVPGEIGYVPRALNNTGGECYPVNTTLQDVNCPPNGHPNPANGNLWLSITDLQAYGGLIDLTLNRNYNSRMAAVDGPFGFGWTGLFLLDYNVIFDSTVGARVITEEVAHTYPVSLNLIWSPHGVVYFTTMSGSQHAFISPENTYDGGAQTLEALTMPGWTLSRETTAGVWMLRQTDGLTYTFDAAGRLQTYGYPQQNRLITVDYPRDSLNGPANINSPVIITDNAADRQLELIYNDSHRISSSRLRSNTNILLTCNGDSDVLETRYSYDDNGYLRDVTYSDCLSATYAYDGNGRLNAHDDVRAPIAQNMQYTYDDAGFLGAFIDDPAHDRLLAWRYRTDLTIRNNIGGTPDARIITIAGDEYAARTYTYQLASDTLRLPGIGYTLINQTSPLAPTGNLDEDVDNFESLPTTYEWENGLLRSERRSLNNVGRNTINYTYAANNLITRISGGYRPFDTTLTPEGLPTSIRLASGATLALTYGDTNGELTTLTDENGGSYRYTWDENNRIQAITSEDDGTVSAYTYNANGQIQSVSQYREGDSPNTYYTVNYIYDSLGRLILIEDPITGVYTIRYPAPADNQQRIVITDMTGAETLLTFNGRGQLMETRVNAINAAADDYLRRTTYRYDVQGRISERSQWLQPTDPQSDAEDTPLTTRYTYSYTLYNFNRDDLAPRTPNDPIPSITLADGDRRDLNIVNGYELRINAPYGEISERIVYDALGRIRLTEDNLRYVRRFDYSVDDIETSQGVFLDNGLRIIQRDFQNSFETPLQTYTYLFNELWRLREATRNVPEAGQDGGDLRQVLRFDFTTDNRLALAPTSSQQAGFFQQIWTGLLHDRPATVEVAQANINNRGTSRPEMGVNYDFRGRPLTLIDGENNVYRLVYCPLESAGERVVTVRANVDITDEVACNTRNFNQITQFVDYDAAGRVTYVANIHGSRTYTYTTQPGAWEVEIIFNTPGIDDPYRWLLTYDSVGDLRQWEDSNGIQRTYRCDSLGRLLRVETQISIENDLIAQPEASFTFAYNAAGLLTFALDDYERGTRYAYNTRGQLTVAQDASTGSATIYGYNSAGQLSTVISPQGNTTTYLYENRADPTRVTGIIGPTGNPIAFTWNDDNRTITYTDSRGNEVVYSFDSVGALWSIEDSGTQANTHALTYDNSGRLTDWQQAFRGNTPARHLQLTYPDPYSVTINEVTDDSGWQRTLTTDADGHLTGLSDGDVSLLSFTYDPLGRLRQITPGDSNEDAIWRLAYARERPQITVNDSFGNQRIVTYDALNRLVSDDGDGTTVFYTYQDGRGGNVDLSADNTATEGTDTRVITFSPGDEGPGLLPSIIFHAPGQRRTYIYDAEGLLSEIRTQVCIPAIDADTVWVDDRCVDDGDVDIWQTSERFIYDTQGRPIRYIDPEDNIATFAYDDAGNLVNYQNVRGQTFNYVYDSLNRLSAITGPTGIRLLIGYDALDNVIGICQSRAEGDTLFADCTNDPDDDDLILEEYTYDALGRLTGQIFTTGDGDPNTITYDYTGNNGLLTNWGLDGEVDVSITRSDDGLNLLSDITVESGDDTVEFAGYGLDYRTLDDLNAINSFGLDGAGDLTYTYDSQGRIATIQTGEHTLNYSYAEDRSGYTITDATSGAALHFALDNNGLLGEIDYVAPEGSIDAPQVSIDFDYVINAAVRVLVIQIGWSNGENIDLWLNRNGTTRTVFYQQTNMVIDYTSGATGQVQQRNITGSPRLFEEGILGYIALIGYDNDGRPLTLRIIERNEGDLLYLLTFTYNARGQRETETRRFRDDAQITITYSYNAANQLERKAYFISESRADSQSAAPLLLLLPLMGGMIGGSRRRRALLLVIASAVLIGVFYGTSQTGAQQDNSFSQVYTYDRAGNLLTVELDINDELRECATYDYDGANRLIQVTQGELVQTYSYDVFNRLVQAGEQHFAYMGDSETIAARFNSDEDSPLPVIYGQTARRAGFFEAQGDSTSWLVSDGRLDIVAVLPDEVDAVVEDPIWLFDPLGRQFTLDFTNINDEIEQLCAALDELSALSYAQTLEPDMIYDPETNLYFKDGRAYAPQIGRYLQRDPQGPDVFGNIYAYPSRQAAPPVRQRAPIYTEGLYRLQEAVNDINATTTFTAAAIGAQFQPSGDDITIDSLNNHLHATASITEDYLLQQLVAPIWLGQHYNLPAPYLDAQGALRMVVDNAPGHGGRVNAPPLPDLGAIRYANVPLMPTIAPPLSRLTTLTEALHVAEQPYTTYQAFAWMPRLPVLTDEWAVTPPTLTNTNTPAGILDWIPSPLPDPQRTAEALRSVEGAIALVNRPGYAWVQAALDEQLPALPDMPPESSAVWLERWFTTDTLGIAEALRARYPAVPRVDFAVPRLGDNLNWFRLE